MGHEKIKYNNLIFCSFKFLGSTIVKNESVKEEIKERIKNADTFYQLVRNI
jgi:hypothetical protein